MWGQVGQDGGGWVQGGGWYHQPAVSGAGLSSGFKDFSTLRCPQLLERGYLTSPSVTPGWDNFFRFWCAKLPGAVDIPEYPPKKILEFFDQNWRNAITFKIA